MVKKPVLTRVFNPENAIFVERTTLRAAEDFPTFLRRCKTFDPAHDEPRKIPEWQFVRRFSEALEKNDRLLVVKSRQMLVTWIGCAYIYYRAKTGGPGIHLLLSKEERSSKEMIARLQFIYKNLPEYEKEEEVKFQSSAIIFPELGTRILSLPAAPYAVRGLSPRTVFWDEMAFTPDDEEIWASAKPAVDAGGRFIGVSTPNGPGGVFARLVHGREKGFEIVRIHYSENPDRDSEWEENARAGLSPARWRREHELSFEGAEGAVYDQFDTEIHVLKDSYKVINSFESRIFRGIDFGYRKPAVIWAELHGDGRLIIFDCVVGDKWSVDQLIAEIKARDGKHGITEKDVHWSAVDPAGAAKTDFGISPVEYLINQHFKILWSSSSITAGIEVVRALLKDATGKVRLQIDPSCTSLIEAFQGYAWGEEGEVPIKDGVYDHPMDALRYLIVNLQRTRMEVPHHSPIIHGVAQKVRKSVFGRIKN
ncbi:MAG: hypothetical protein P9L92_18745 [Candidatus Electryonea clarkiae]|nr:hypothetical protein [Candidatus Electryonea clarkiae]MDP8287838.1 hypothetical protein [Candidatus Electryonea clarkiae]